mgnify:CR=1 FL=1
MAQAKVLTQSELDQVLRYLSTKRYAKRDRCLILTSFWSGMRVGEIAQLKMRDVVNEDGTVKNEIKLSAHQTKGNTARVVFIPRKLKEEILDYLTTRMIKNPEIPRPFRAPLVPLVSTLGVLICLGMIVALDAQTLKVAFGWMIFGIIIYFGYSQRNSKLHKK